MTLQAEIGMPIIASVLSTVEPAQPGDIAAALRIEQLAEEEKRDPFTLAGA
jgi:hypothetical protein